MLLIETISWFNVSVMDAFIAVPIATYIGVSLSTLVLATSMSPRRMRWLLGDRIARFSAVDRHVLDAELSRAARSASRGLEASVLGLIVLLLFRFTPIVADTLARAPFDVAIVGLIVTVGAGVLLAYAEFAWVRGAILRRLDRAFASPHRTSTSA
jgi:hypothetical protein